MKMTTNKNLSDLVKELIENKDIDNNTDNLVELKTLLSSADNKQLEELLNQINVNQFCSDLNNFEDEHNIELIVSIFDVVFGNLSPKFILKKFPKEILIGLDAKNESIVQLWLKTVDRCLAQELALNQTIDSELDIHQIVVKVVQLLSRPKTLTAKYCHSIALNIAKSNIYGEKFFEKDVQNMLTSSDKKDAIVSLRIYELLVSVSNTSHKSFAKVEGFGHLNRLLVDFIKYSESDPLVTLNLLEIVKDLGSTSYGTEYLKTSDILKIVSERLNSSESDLFGNLLTPGYIKLFGALAANEATILEKYPSVLNRLKHCLSETDTNIMLCAIDAIAIICRKNSGKAIINRESDLLNIYMSTMSSLIKSGSIELKSKALMALNIMLKVEEPDPQNVGTSFAESCFRRLLDEQRLATLLKTCKEPFLETRLAAIECLRVLASHLWGQKELAAFPGFLEYILDRKTEVDKKGKEAKYLVVRELLRSPFINTSFTKEAIIQLKAYDKEGPYYVASETAVAFETN